MVPQDCPFHLHIIFNCTIHPQVLLDTFLRPFPEIKSKESLVAKHLTEAAWKKLNQIRTGTSKFTLSRAIACALQYDDQHCGIYAGDWDSYIQFSDVFDPIINDYHNISPTAIHKSDMHFSKINKRIDSNARVKSIRIRVGRNFAGFGLSPGISREQRLQLEKIMATVFAGLPGDLKGKYHPLSTMAEEDRQKLVDDHFLFVSGDKNLTAAGMERDWPEGRGIFHNEEKNFLVWVNEEDQLRIIAMKRGSDIKGAFLTLVRGIVAIEEALRDDFGHKVMLHRKYGYIHSCPTNLGTGMRASVHIELPGFTKLGTDVLKKRCEDLALQARGTRGESGGYTDITYDISNKHRLGYTEVGLILTLVNGINTLAKEDKQILVDLSPK